ncbi:hypothetical protein C1645_774983 [Glomus cerebriforme]|uniref:Uncharacterized protein n=1 Tax=Glomus cerebriforme TaxID=658196 RepID=A0A397SWL1_9GLOM|nr:hypothetical protein C1645_774983 [Glomus cerebriforme]
MIYSILLISVNVQNSKYIVSSHYNKIIYSSDFKKYNDDHHMMYSCDIDVHRH